MLTLGTEEGCLAEWIETDAGWNEDAVRHKNDLGSSPGLPCT